MISKATLDTFQRNRRNGDTVRRRRPKPPEERARLAYSTQIGGVNTSVARLQAELSDAEYDLDQTTVKPRDRLRDAGRASSGRFTVPIPLRR